jgi:thiol:disulfide interchange protein DsbG
VKPFAFLAALALVLPLAACKESPTSSPPAAKTAATAPVSIDTIAAQAQGFNVGAAMSARVAYVFFDPQCPHCAALWEAARPLKNQARFVWIPVGLINQNSVEQGAAMLGAADPVALMDAHERLMREQKGGIVPSGDIASKKDAIKKNTQLMESFGFASVPTLVAKNAQGAVVTQSGSLPTPALAAFLGVQTP